VAKDKNGKVALIAVRDKLLKQAFAIVRSGQPYQANFTSKLALNSCLSALCIDSGFKDGVYDT
jgi:transposase